MPAKNALLERAARTADPMSKRGILEGLFTLFFQGFVYNQIWEDPDVDLEALELTQDTSVVTIASAGCNVLNYLAADPKRVIAVDLNPNHIAITRLKLTALRELPYEQFFRFFGAAKGKENAAVFDSAIAPKLDPDTRAYWEKRMPLYGRRVNMFARNLYRHALLGRFIGVLHALAAINGTKIGEILNAQTLEEQRAIFNRTIGPLFETKLVRALARMPVSFYGLGIPPNQYDELVAISNGNPASMIKARIERLACDFPLKENYFAWQAFSRSYDLKDRAAVPPYLRREVFEQIRTRTGRVSVHHASMTDFLNAQPVGSIDRFVFLDAQDWMTPEQNTALWRAVNRAASPGARVIFRTAGEESPLPRKLPAEVLAPWTYHADKSQAWHRRDRSSIYGGFHLYTKAAA